MTEHTGSTRLRAVPQRRLIARLGENALFALGFVLFLVFTSGLIHLH